MEVEKIYINNAINQAEAGYVISCSYKDCSTPIETVELTARLIHDHFVLFELGNRSPAHSWSNVFDVAHNHTYLEKSFRKKAQEVASDMSKRYRARIEDRTLGKEFKQE